MNHQVKKIVTCVILMCCNYVGFLKLLRMLIIIIIIIFKFLSLSLEVELSVFGLIVRYKVTQRIRILKFLCQVFLNC